MQLLKDRIRKDGKIKAGNVLKVDSFLNHQMDIKLFEEIGKEFKRRFADVEVNKILTIEASGIGIACIVARHFGVPVVFAKKTQSVNIDGEVYQLNRGQIVPEEKILEIAEAFMNEMKLPECVEWEKI